MLFEVVRKIGRGTEGEEGFEVREVIAIYVRGNATLRPVLVDLIIVPKFESIKVFFMEFRVIALKALEDMTSMITVLDWGDNILSWPPKKFDSLFGHPKGWQPSVFSPEKTW